MKKLLILTQTFLLSVANINKDLKRLLQQIVYYVNRSINNSLNIPRSVLLPSTQDTQPILTNTIQIICQTKYKFSVLTVAHTLEKHCLVWALHFPFSL